MERIDNDSPRQPVWQILLDGKTIYQTTGYLVDDADAIELDTRRCICGARPTPAGILPCDH